MTPPHPSGPDRPDSDGPAPRTPRLRAGDDERDAVLDVLARAHGASRLDPTPSPGSLAHSSNSDIVPVVPGGGSQETIVAVLSGREHICEPGTILVRSYALMGRDEVYLGDALGQGVQVTLECYAIWAGNDVYVPAGVKVLDRTANLMAGNTIAKNARGDGSNGTVILTGFSLVAGHDVKLDPNWRPRAIGG